jgi:hypothetical protein
MNTRLTFLVCAASLFVLKPALAATIPTAAIWGGEVRVDSAYVVQSTIPLSEPGETFLAHYDPPHGDTITALTSTGILPAPFVSSNIFAESVAGKRSFVDGRAYALLDYSFVIHGPTGLVPVHVDAMGGIATSGIPYGGNSFVSAAFSVTSSGAGGNLNLGSAVQFRHGFLHRSISASGGVTGSIASGYSGEFLIDGDYMAETNRVYNVRLTTDAFTTISSELSLGGGSISLSAYVDPSFTIALTDPVLASLYSIEFSPGIVPAGSAVPDGAFFGTGTAGLTMLALGLLAVAKRLLTARRLTA